MRALDYSDDADDLANGSNGTFGQEFGGGIASEATAAFANTLIATNSAATDPDVSAAVTSSGFNLIGKSNGSEAWIETDKTGTIASPLDPLLGPLAFNGGTTKTMMPLEGSPALDAGESFGRTFDQRGSKRPVNLSSVPNAPGSDGSDIGAVERQGLTPSQTPFKTFIIGSTPLIIQAEDFDNGGEGIAYHDVDAANLGTAYRKTGVDLQPTTDTGGGYNVGWTKAGEWLEYTVNVQSAGPYDIDFRIAASVAGGKFHLEADGKDVTGALTAPATGGWQSWKTLRSAAVNLTAGKHVLRLKFDAAATANGSIGNFNYLKFTRAGSVTVNTNTAAHVRDGSYASTNYGNSPTLEVKKNRLGYSRETYLRFDLNAVPSITSAKLRLYGKLLGTENPSMSLAVEGSSNTNWNEATLTWNSKPAPGPQVGSFTVTGTIGKWYEVDVTSYLKTEKAAGRNVVTLAIRSTQIINVVCGFNSDEADADRPHLLISQ